MSHANVQCAGLPFEQHGPHSAQATEPCGWKGERFPLRWPKGQGAHSIPAREGVEPTTIDITAKPCPRCGGRVQLLEVVS